MSKVLLEVCVDSVESAIAAAQGGADRIELCSDLIIGGTTPSPILFKEIKKHVNIPIHILIRPRFGDFCYSLYELAIIKEEIKMFRELGADGIVIGVLTPTGALDIVAMRDLLTEAGDMSVTLHRVFDVCKDPFEAMEQAISLGFHTILTSGQKGTCKEGKELLRELIARSEGRITIMPGSGVTLTTIHEVVAYTGATACHMSGKVTIDSPVSYRKEGVNMGLKEVSEYEIWQTDKEIIRQAKAILTQKKGE